MRKELSKAGKRRSKHDSGTSGIGAGDLPDEQPAAADENEVPDEGNDRRDVDAAAPVPGVETTVSADPDHVYTRNQDLEQAPASDKESPTSPQSGVRGWIKNRLSRGKSVSEQEPPAEKEKKRRSLFRSGTSKRGQNGTISSLEPRSSSMHDVAMAGRGEDGETHEPVVGLSSGARDSRGVSPVSSPEERIPDNRGDEDEMRPPRPIVDSAPRSSISPNRGTRFREEMGV